MTFDQSLLVAIVSASCSAVLSSLIAGGFIAFLTQRLTEQRERRTHRDELRLDLYLEVVQLVIDYMTARRALEYEAVLPPQELGARGMALHYRLRLVGSAQVLELFDKYKVAAAGSVVAEHSRRTPGKELGDARDLLLEAMARETTPR